MFILCDLIRVLSYVKCRAKIFLSVMDSTHSVNCSETLTNFRSAGVLAIFQTDNCTSVWYRLSSNT